MPGSHIINLFPLISVTANLSNSKFNTPSSIHDNATIRLLKSSFYVLNRTLSSNPSQLHQMPKLVLILILILHTLPLLLLHADSPPPSPAEALISLRIDCGGNANSTDAYGNTWLSDRYFTAGYPSVVSEPLQFGSMQGKTLRFFPISSGKKNCYVIPSLPSGRYLFRTFTVYDNYDGKSYTPSFDVSVEGTLVFSWRSPWSEDTARNGAYSDLFAFVKDGEADVCFYSIATDPPVIASLEVVQVDPLSYDAATNGDSQILVNYGRLSCGSKQWGAGFSNDSDQFSRTWQSDVEFRSRTSGEIKALSALNTIKNTNQPPNYFPMKLYQEAVTVMGDGALVYELPVDAKLDYLVWFHFVEIDSSMNNAGKRVFDVVVNEKNVSRVDIYDKVGLFAAYDFSYVVKNLSSMVLNVKLLPIVGKPIISGLENYALVPADLSTRPEQVIAMRALKDSLRIPVRMGWNGDPCAPITWDAWEGVTCRVDKNSSFLVIDQIDLGSQGLKGYISDQISLLTNLVSLNLSYNSLGGGIPTGMGHKSFARLDLSNNRLTGLIPESLYSDSLQLVLLNGNLLEGSVPEQLYSIGVHGGTIDLSGNKNLCGAPSLPACPMFWDHNGLSNAGKIGVAVACVVFVCLVLLVYFLCIRKGKNDYDFGLGLPNELMSLAAKRNRYERQKSLMLHEMQSQQSQHAKGFPSISQ